MQITTITVTFYVDVIADLLQSWNKVSSLNIMSHLEVGKEKRTSGKLEPTSHILYTLQKAIFPFSIYRDIFFE